MKEAAHDCGGQNKNKGRQKENNRQKKDRFGAETAAIHAEINDLIGSDDKVILEQIKNKFKADDGQGHEDGRETEPLPKRSAEADADKRSKENYIGKVTDVADLGGNEADKNKFGKKNQKAY